MKILRTYTFRIRGNQENKLGNPIPYFRTTQKSKWSDPAQRYATWKSYVRGALFDSGCKFTPSMVQQYGADRPPLVLEKGQKAYMDIFITWADETHGDSDNVFKGIADAVFENDKHMAGAFNYCHGEEGGVEVRIAITEDDGEPFWGSSIIELLNPKHASISAQVEGIITRKAASV